jgi:hypothetical protein
MTGTIKHAAGQGQPGYIETAINATPADNAPVKGGKICKRLSGRRFELMPHAVVLEALGVLHRQRHANI